MIIHDSSCIKKHTPPPPSPCHAFLYPSRAGPIHTIPYQTRSDQRRYRAHLSIPVLPIYISRTRPIPHLVHCKRRRRCVCGGGRGLNKRESFCRAPEETEVAASPNSGNYPTAAPATKKKRCGH